MRFTAEQYNAAIAGLVLARARPGPGGNPCAVCGDSGHAAWECGHSPLATAAMCREVARIAEQAHGALHRLAGFDQAFGVQLGPGKFVIPDSRPEAPMVFQEPTER